MVMMSLALTDQLPFEHVYLHAMVCVRMELPMQFAESSRFGVSLLVRCETGLAVR